MLTEHCEGRDLMNGKNVRLRLGRMRRDSGILS